jgi:hypothetical protein
LRNGLIALALLAGIAASAAARVPHGATPAEPKAVTPDGDPPISYTVRRGDNLYNLALHYMHRLNDYRTVQTLNRVRDPYRIPVGTSILIPRALLRSDPLPGKVIAFRGATTIDGQAAIIGATVSEGERIRTGPNAFVSIGLTDGTTITLPSQTSVRVERLRRFRLTNEMDRLFHVDEGRIQTEVTPRTNGRDRFEMRTRISVAAVRGTDFRVAVLDDGKAATTEVLGGHVGLIGGGTETNLDPGVGARVTAEGTTGPVQLLPSPALVDGAHIQSEPDLVFGVVPLDKAVRYRFQVARDAGFLDITEEAIADRPQATLPSVPNGDYFVRVTAIDANEIEGLPRIIGFERHLNALRAAAESLGGHRYLFKWQDLGDGAHQYRFVIARADAPDIPVVDEPALTTKSFVATDLLPGDYVWHVQTSGVSNGKIYSNWSALQTLTVAGDARPAKKRAQPPAS